MNSLSSFQIMGTKPTMKIYIYIQSVKICLKECRKCPRTSQKLVNIEALRNVAFQTCGIILSSYTKITKVLTRIGGPVKLASGLTRIQSK